MPVKKTKRAVVPPLAAVLPNVTLKEFRHGGAEGTVHRLALLTAWAKACPKAPATYLVDRMRRDYGIGVAWVEAFEVVRKAREQAHSGRVGRPVGVQAKQPLRKPRRWKDAPEAFTMEGALSALHAAAKRMGIGITLTFNAAVAA